MSALVQSVNFYQEMFHKPKVAFPFKKMWVACGVMMTSVVMFALVDFSRTTSLSEHYEKQLNAKIRLESSVAKLQETVNAMIEDPQLKNREQRLKEELQQRYRLLSAIKVQGNTHSMPFSGYLKGLSEIENKHIWLTKIHLQSPGPDIRLSGMASKPEAIPAYIAQFKSDTHFNGMGFRVFHAERLQKNSEYMLFEISTRHARQPDK